MKRSLIAALGATLFALATSGAAHATTLYDNLYAASDGADPVGTLPDGSPWGPLADSFSTGSSSFSFGDLKLLLGAGSPTDGGSITVSLFSDSGTAPASSLDLLGTISDSALSSTPSIVDLTFGPIPLAANTRYWIELADAGLANGDSVSWSWTYSVSGPGVGSEFFYNLASGVSPNDPNGGYQMQIAVPEPITLSLLGAGLAGAAAFRRRRKVAKPS